MKSFFHTFFLATLILVVCHQPVRTQQQPADSLTNDSVIKLSKAGFKEKTIISVIFARVPSFDLSADRLVDLKRSGVSEKVIMAMLARQQGSDSFDEDDWNNDSLSSGSSDPKLPGSDGTGIFGSSSGQRNKTQTNRAGDSSTADTATTGSATVRILRPPSEAGAPSKLEKTKSLTNQSVVELVEAGFSEGTIIRRIEQSPVEFDLAAPKIEELRKRRVSDRILNAMKIAMGDESVK
jgi:hypothetical protein